MGCDRSHASGLVVLLVFGLLVGTGVCPLLMADGGETDEAKPHWKNPYYPKCGWRVWRLNPEPIPEVGTLVYKKLEGQKKAQKVQVRITLGPVPAAERLYPSDAGSTGKPGVFLAYGKQATPSKRYAGIWDDVYASWSGLHGYVRDGWKDASGNEIKGVKAGIMHLVDMDRGRNIFKLGINFFHQSTTGMGHMVSNGYSAQKTLNFERFYFASGLITGPAHNSFMDASSHDARSFDLYMALFPTMFNSLGSSNSETMAITKLIAVGGYLSPEMKLKLKTHGLYPSALLYMWKAGLPYTAPYDSEVRHRVAYKSVGNRFVYPGRYGAAGITKGDLCPGFHQYDDTAHMRNMVAMAKAMKVAPPEAILKVAGLEGGRGVYNLKKTVLVVQEDGQDITLRVSTADSYDIDGRPLTFRWKLLYGNKNVTVEREGDTPVYKISVPFDKALPEGRTTLLLIANNGVSDGNPAAVNIYRKRAEIPGPGSGYKDYTYKGELANRRPIIYGLQDRAVKPGETVRIEIHARDPEGFPMTYYRRSGEVGQLDGNVFTWTCPKNEPAGDKPVTIIGSDGTSGNSYEAQQIQLQVSPKTFASIAAKRFTGKAPLEIEFSAAGSFDAAAGDLQYGWAAYLRKSSPVAPKKPKLVGKAQTYKHTFKTPGIYEVYLWVKGPSGEDHSKVTVYVPAKSRGQLPPVPGLTGNGVNIASGDTTPSPFDHTEFGPVEGGSHADREYHLTYLGWGPMTLHPKHPVKITGPHAGDFTVVTPARSSIDDFGSSRFVVRFTPRGPGRREAVVEIQARKGGPLRQFAIGGHGIIDQAKIDAPAEPAWQAARALFAAEKWLAARAALEALTTRWPAATQARRAKALLAQMSSDPRIKAAVAKVLAERQAAEAARKKTEAAAAGKRAVEAKARSLWNMAQNFERNGQQSLARTYLEKLVKQYPETQYGKQARKALQDD